MLNSLIRVENIFEINLILIIRVYDRYADM